MDILKILELRYSEYEWSLAGNEYVGLTWHETDVPKPNEAELVAIWEDEDFQKEIEEDDVLDSRRADILSEWPVHEQFEALTEAQMGRTDKLNELINYINLTKEKYPKP